ncbi:hypothetical protein PG994_013530 [Apiospora phragmitis]|uniref:AB hydrolase-1 domain-containing protein n=1 Tax=Apiospora phragmitis TaxID=2905665 RepID=A0ABR1T8X1_9PEZI
MPLRRETFTVSEDTELSYVTNLTDPTARLLFFLHFWGGSYKMYSPVLDTLLGGQDDDDEDGDDRAAAPHHQVLALDFRGWGRSTGPLSCSSSRSSSSSSSSPSSHSSDSSAPSSSPSSHYYNYSISSLASDVEALMQHLRLRNVVLVGHSMGGKVAQVVSGRSCFENKNKSTQRQQKQNNDRQRLITKALVLLAPAPARSLELPDALRKQQIHAYETREAAEFVTRNVLLSPGSLRKVEGGQESSSWSSSWSDEDEDEGAAAVDVVVEALVNDMLRGSAAARAAWPAYAMGEDVSAWAEAIDVPVLVCAGEEDKVEPMARVRAEVCGVIRGAKLVTIPGAGHLLPIEAPARVSSLIVGFLRELDSWTTVK